MANEIKMDEVNRLINYTIDNGFKLQEKGKMPIAVSLEATAGIGKTSIVRQIAEDRNMTFVKINLAQLDEPGDLLGYPIIEYECQTAIIAVDEKGEKKFKILPNTVWVTEKQMETKDSNTKYKKTGKVRTGYAKPAWVPEYNPNGCVVLLDDYVRANPQLLQSTMDLILEQKYASWEFPQKTVIFLTNNPDDGDNNVNSLDEAQRTRFVNFSVGFDINAWMRWAEEANVDGRCINFVASYYNELFNANEDGDRICNPRSFVMFADMISGIKDWDVPENLAFIQLIAKGCFKDDGRFSQMFGSFIRNKMHLIVQPKEILKGKWSDVEKILHETLYGKDDTNYELTRYNPALASMLERRFANYVCAWLKSDEKTPIKVVSDRILDFIRAFKNGHIFFNHDLLFHMLKTITSENRSQTNKLMFEPEIAKILS